MDKIFFSYERMEPMKYATPHDIRNQLYKYMCGIYKNKQLSSIPLSTEIILKEIKPKDITKTNITLLKFKVVNEDWEDTRNLKDVFASSMFRWVKEEEPDY